MADILIKNPKTFSEYVKIIEDLQAASVNKLWFRGISKQDHKLLPSFYRTKDSKTIKEHEKVEKKLLNWFKQRSIPYHNRSLEDPWEQLFFMQHYGIPTRLLDWTENPFIGLYFAVINCEKSNPKSKVVKYKDDCAVWILDAAKWNKHSLKRQGFDEDILSPIDPEVKGYAPGSEILGEKPVALYGAHNSARIVSQRGVFIIFGNNINPMEVLSITDGYPQECLIKVVIDKDAISDFKKAIFNNGITESVIFPDLEGLAKETKRVFGYGE